MKKLTPGRLNLLHGVMGGRTVTETQYSITFMNMSGMSNYNGWKEKKNPQWSSLEIPLDGSAASIIIKVSANINEHMFLELALGSTTNPIQLNQEYEISAADIKSGLITLYYIAAVHGYSDRKSNLTIELSKCQKFEN